MKNRVLALLLASALLLTARPCAIAQAGNNGTAAAVNSAAQDWQGARDLKPGKKIRVEFKSGGTIDGKVVSLEGSTLTMSGGGSHYVLEQRDIQRIYSLRGGWSRRKLARIGAIVGFLVGSEIGARKMFALERNPNRPPSDADGIPMIAGMTVGTAAGAGLGWLLGGKRKGKLLYEAKQAGGTVIVK